ncbi:hypothetical protein Bca101_049035 [Brassica carinata]|uniref:Uncharacterized protein n=1 Tax=Brassica oleracea TaxID=3712 RepID=A0A3P6DK24_BRAOL|nr:unnamed protein product [Brassica oleracea]
MVNLNIDRSVTTVRVSVIQLESALCFIMCLSYMVCDAIEVKGRNIMVASSTVTTELSSQITAAGHALRTAGTVFKIRQSLPKSV